MPRKKKPQVETFRRRLALAALEVTTRTAAFARALESPPVPEELERSLSAAESELESAAMALTDAVRWPDVVPGPDPAGAKKLPELDLRGLEERGGDEARVLAGEVRRQRTELLALREEVLSLRARLRALTTPSVPQSTNTPVEKRVR